MRKALSSSVLTDTRWAKTEETSLLWITPAGSEDVTVQATPTSGELVIDDIDEDEPTGSNVPVICPVLVASSHMFGMHPFKATCPGSKKPCPQRRNAFDSGIPGPTKTGLLSRLSAADVALGCFNMAVAVNHFRLLVVPQIQALRCTRCSGIPSFQSAEFAQEFIGAVLPMLTIFWNFVYAADIHEVMQLLVDAKYEFHERINQSKVLKLRVLMYIVNIFFAVSVLVHFPQTFVSNFSNELTGNATFALSGGTGSLAMELEQAVVKGLSFVDRYYFPFMAFGTTQVPQLLIMVIGLSVGMLFKENASMLRSEVLSRHTLVAFFKDYKQLHHVLTKFEKAFNRNILLLVSVTVARITIKLYAEITDLMWHTHKEARVVPGSVDVEPAEVAFLAFNAIDVAISAVWTVAFLVPCVYVNEMARSATALIEDELVDDDAKPVKDQIIQKLTDPLWGVTMGKFMKVDRQLILTMISAVFTILVVWLQFGEQSRKARVMLAW
ncbi:hypothetical protein AAVH_26676 [Aphelenchoides avenae]|nr:hypothetical protein AAVH_26676 [Aphelenchus avenae]